MYKTVYMKLQLNQKSECMDDLEECNITRLLYTTNWNKTEWSKSKWRMNKLHYIIIEISIKSE